MKSQPNEDTNPALIRDIHSHRFTFRTRLRVGRIWRPKTYSGQDYDGLHYLLIDEKVVPLQLDSLKLFI